LQQAQSAAQIQAQQLQQVEFVAHKHVKQVRVFAVAAAGWDPEALASEQLAHSGGSRDRRAPKMERHRRPQPTHKSYWAQWKSLAVTNGILQRQWESAYDLK
jgi:hypothetical protein